MTIQADMALMAAGSYWDTRRGALNPVMGIDTSKRQRGQVLPFALMTIDTFHWAPPYSSRHVIAE
jgi:hypothetical protein